MSAYSERVLEIFENIARGYDRGNDRISFGLHRWWKRSFVRHISDVTPRGGSMLDSCCGTGDIALTLARLRPDVSVTGLDFSQQMLNVAREKARGLPNLVFVQGSAERLMFTDGSFDVSAVSFGLRNLELRLPALCEMARVSRKAVFCLDSSMPENTVIRTLFTLYFKKVMPLLGGGLDKTTEYEWLDRSTEMFFTKRELKKMFECAGLKNIEVSKYSFGVCAEHRGSLSDDNGVH
ncbi:MAG: ubiquinone/menaquinone biosynthesis methyltransferase [Oscillospiraceae bacterium]